MYDVFVLLAIYSLFKGWLPFALDIDQAFIGSLLTMIGYSMNDKIVIFDRIRSYLHDPVSKKDSIGVIVGTYSSLFIASPTVVDALQRTGRNPALAAPQVMANDFSFQTKSEMIVKA